LVYTPEEAAIQLRISRTKVYALLRRGEVRSVKIDGSRHIPVAALSEYIALLERRAAWKKRISTVRSTSTRARTPGSLRYPSASTARGDAVRRKVSVVLPRKWQERPVDEQRQQAVKLLAPKIKKLREEAEKGIKA
jgi:excisionase family DNA binding protein